MIYSWQKDLLSVPKEQILLNLYNAIINDPDGVHIDKHPSLQSAKRAIELSEKDGKLETFCGEKININFLTNNFDFSVFEKYYSPKILQNAILETQIQGVEMNAYLNNLEEKANKFNMSGKYLYYSNAKDPVYNGLYFVCGYDIEKILDKNIDIENIVKRQNISSIYKLDIHAEKLSNSNPFAVSQNVLHYCSIASTMQMLQRKYGITNRLDECSRAFITYVHMLCANSNNHKLGFEKRMDNQTILNGFFPDQARDELSTKGRGSPEAYFPHVIPEKKPFFSKQNMVSLKELAEQIFNIPDIKFLDPDELDINQNYMPFDKLLYDVGDVSVVQVPDNYTKQMKMRLEQECPEVEFAMGKSKKHTLFFYDAKYQPKVQLQYLYATKPFIQERTFQFDDLQELKKDFCTVGIHYKDLKPIFNEADKAGVKVCLNNEKYYFSHSVSADDFEKGNFIYPISFPVKQKIKFRKIANKTNVLVLYKPEINPEPVHGMRTIYPPLESMKQIKSWLSKHPDVIYFQAKPVTGRLHGALSRSGFGSPEANKSSSILMAFDSNDIGDIRYNLLKGRYPEYFKYSIEDIRKMGKEDVENNYARGSGTSSFGADLYDLDRIFNTANFYNIPICLNQEKLRYTTILPKMDFTDNCYTITFPSKYTESINSILEKISELDLNKELLSKEDIRIYSSDRFDVIENDREEQDWSR